MTQHWNWMEDLDPNMQERWDKGDTQSSGEKDIVK